MLLRIAGQIVGKRAIFLTCQKRLLVAGVQALKRRRSNQNRHRHRLTQNGGFQIAGAYVDQHARSNVIRSQAALFSRKVVSSVTDQN